MLLMGRHISGWWCREDLAIVGGHRHGIGSMGCMRRFTHRIVLRVRTIDLTLRKVTIGITSSMVIEDMKSIIALIMGDVGEKRAPVHTEDEPD